MILEKFPYSFVSDYVSDKIELRTISIKIDDIDDMYKAIYYSLIEEPTVYSYNYNPYSYAFRRDGCHDLYTTTTITRDGIAIIYNSWVYLNEFDNNQITLQLFPGIYYFSLSGNITGVYTIIKDTVTSRAPLAIVDTQIRDLQILNHNIVEISSLNGTIIDAPYPYITAPYDIIFEFNPLNYKPNEDIIPVCFNIQFMIHIPAFIHWYHYYNNGVNLNFDTRYDYASQFPNILPLKTYQDAHFNNTYIDENVTINSQGKIFQPNDIPYCMIYNNVVETVSSSITVYPGKKLLYNQDSTVYTLAGDMLNSIYYPFYKISGKTISSYPTSNNSVFYFDMLDLSNNPMVDEYCKPILNHMIDTSTNTLKMYLLLDELHQGVNKNTYYLPPVPGLSKLELKFNDSSKVLYNDFKYDSCGFDLKETYSINMIIRNRPNISPTSVSDPYTIYKGTDNTFVFLDKSSTNLYFKKIDIDCDIPGLTSHRYLIAILHIDLDVFNNYMEHTAHRTKRIFRRLYDPVSDKQPERFVVDNKLVGITEDPINNPIDLPSSYSNTVQYHDYVNVQYMYYYDDLLRVSDDVNKGSIYTIKSKVFLPPGTKSLSIFNFNAVVPITISLDNPSNIYREYVDYYHVDLTDDEYYRILFTRHQAFNLSPRPPIHININEFMSSFRISCPDYHMTYDEFSIHEIYLSNSEISDIMSSYPDGVWVYITCNDTIQSPLYTFVEFDRSVLESYIQTIDNDLIPNNSSKTSYPELIYSENKPSNIPSNLHDVLSYSSTGISTTHSDYIYIKTIGFNMFNFNYRVNSMPSLNVDDWFTVGPYTIEPKSMEYDQYEL